MWNHYKSTFTGMQIIIAVVSVSVYMLFGHVISLAALFFATMQIGSLIGSVWAVRLRGKVHRQTAALPLQGRL